MNYKDITESINKPVQTVKITNNYWKWNVNPTIEGTLNETFELTDKFRIKRTGFIIGDKAWALEIGTKYERIMRKIPMGTQVCVTYLGRIGTHGSNTFKIEIPEDTEFQEIKEEHNELNEAFKKAFPNQTGGQKQ